MSMTLDVLTEELKRTFGESLTSVVLYGSAAAGDHTGKRSDYNVLVVAERIDSEHLRTFSKSARKWAQGGNPPPLFFTLERLRASTGHEIQVRAEAWVALNGRPAQLLIDPAVDLATQQRSLWPVRWILPLESR